MEYVEELKLLNGILRKSDKVNSFDREDHNEASTIAYALLDIRESFEKIYKTHLPILQKRGIRSEDIDDILLEIGYELEHILYHIQDCGYYSYLHSYHENFFSAQSSLK